MTATTTLQARVQVLQMIVNQPKYSGDTTLTMLVDDIAKEIGTSAPMKAPVSKPAPKAKVAKKNGRGAWTEEQKQKLKETLARKKQERLDNLKKSARKPKTTASKKSSPARVKIQADKKVDLSTSKISSNNIEAVVEKKIKAVKGNPKLFTGTDNKITHEFPKSKAIVRATYHVDTKVLEVKEFKTGKIERYDKVPVSVYNELTTSPNAGLFYNNQIKKVFETVKRQKKQILVKK